VTLALDRLIVARNRERPPDVCNRIESCRVDSFCSVEQEESPMYSVVLMLALSGGADAPALNDVPAEPVARYGDHGRKEYRLLGGRRGGCCGGSCGGCYGGGYYGGCSGGCCGGGYYGGCYGGRYSGSCGGCYGGCYGGRAYGGMGGGYYGAMPYVGGYDSSWYGTPTYYGAPMYYGGSTYQGGYEYGRAFEGTGYFDVSAIEAPATLVVRLPADAKLTVDGSATRSTDSVRAFVSPPLQPGKDYHYTLRAEVTRDGKKVERTRDVSVRAGQTSEVNFDFAGSIPQPRQ
jgi:uncharacterized protein (TIGR03000 family)